MRVCVVCSVAVEERRRRREGGKKGIDADAERSNVAVAAVV